MNDTANTERENAPIPPPKTERSTSNGDESNGDEAESPKTVKVNIRITPLSLLWSAVIGTVALGILVLAGAWVLSVPLFSVGSGSSGAVFSLSSGLWLILASVALLLVLFATGYRRHGRPAPTEAEVREGALSVKVPAAWGKLIREALYLEDPHLEKPDRENRTGPYPSSSLPSADPAGPGVVITGTAREWWDPGTYEMHGAPEDAEFLRSMLTSETEETPSQ